MMSKHQFFPLCDVHHVPMRRVMLEENSEDVRSYHACERRDCTRIFRDSNGYSDRTEGQFDGSRTSTRTCPRCGAVLYLAEVDRSQKVETWPAERAQFLGRVSIPFCAITRLDVDGLSEAAGMSWDI